MSDMTASRPSQKSFARSRRILAAAIFALVACTTIGPAGAQSPWKGSCAAPRDLLVSTMPLPHVARKLALGGRVKVVAFGSSSTAGTGASSVAATYPSRFAAELQRLFPQARVSILNKGVPGEDVRDEMLRFERDVLDEHPDLLIWQTGTNSALHRNALHTYVGKLTRGIDEARAAGIDVLLMSPQFSPRFEDVPNHADYLDHLATVAALRDVPLLRRYEIMKFWLNSGEMTPKDMVASDGLHQTDASYYCLGVVTARMVAGLANRPAFLASVTAVAARITSK
jgi:lysophospholipase L1-like esterase